MKLALISDNGTVLESIADLDDYNLERPIDRMELMYRTVQMVLNHKKEDA